MILQKSRRHFARYKEIARVIAHHGWGWVLGRMGFSESGKKLESKKEATAASAHLREMLEELGPTFVKLGQILSTRPDIIPDPYITELSKLQDTAPTVHTTEIKKVIESELKAKIEDLFLFFDDIPLAAASIAQVHKATLKDGTNVIVKVQRPNIRETIDTDLEILYSRARFLEDHWDAAKTFGVVDIVDEFALTLKEELDFIREARNNEKLGSTGSDKNSLCVPKVFWDYTTSKILTLEFIDGIKITDIEKYPENIDRSQVANRLATSFMEQIFINGFFHADPHPGNIFIKKDGCIVLLDAGEVGRLDMDSRSGAVRMLMAFERQDTRYLADEILEMGISREEVDIRRFTYDLGKLIRNYYDLPAQTVDMGELLIRVLKVSASHKIKLPANFATMGKVFSNIEGICRVLDPDLNFTEVLKNYMSKVVKSELKSSGLLTELFSSIIGVRGLLLSLPDQLDRLMRKLVEGTLRVEFKHQNLEGVSESFERGANRISISLIIASIIIGSSLVVKSDKGPTAWYGLSTLGLVGYMTASIFGIWLIVSIIKTGRHK
ncbi:MAG: AarF/ABC1/UbiB kinase family protein [Armatimonadota bacterium]